MPAILVLSTANSTCKDLQQAKADRDLMALWLELFQYVAKTGVEVVPAELGSLLRAFDSLDP